MNNLRKHASQDAKKNAIGEIKNLIRTRGLSKTKARLTVAKQLGVTSNTLYNWERTLDNRIIGINGKIRKVNHHPNTNSITVSEVKVKDSLNVTRVVIKNNQGHLLGFTKDHIDLLQRIIQLIK